MTLPGAFVGVLLSTGSAIQAGAVQILILLSILLSQTCAVAVTLELIARGCYPSRGPCPPRSATVTDYQKDKSAKRIGQCGEAGDFTRTVGTSCPHSVQGLVDLTVKAAPCGLIHRSQGGFVVVPSGFELRDRSFFAPLWSPRLSL